MTDNDRPASNGPSGDSASAGSQPEYPWLRTYPDNVNWHHVPEPRPLYELLDASARDYPNHVCTNFMGRKLTYAQIARLVDQAAVGLQARGVERGTKVGLFLPNSPTFIIYYYAILKAGGVVVNYNPLYTVEELAYQVRDSETQIMVTLDLKLLFDKVEELLATGVLQRAIVASFPALLPGTKSALFKLFKSRDLARPLASKVRDRIVSDNEVRATKGTLTPTEIDPTEEIAVLQYTGGTTGTPKGAMLTHANVYINAKQVAAWAPNLVTGGERVMGVLPFFHVFAMTVVMNFGVLKAAEIIIMPRFILLDALKLISATKPTVMPGVPTLYNGINNYPKLKDYNLTSLKFCISGGAALPVEVKSRFESLTGCTVVEGYGLSESSPVATCNIVDGLVKEGSIGVPFPGTVVSLRDLADPTLEVPLGEKGEVCISGPQVMKGYWKREEETAGVFVGEFLRTGDVARCDEDGMFFIEDRIKDLIICSGYNVYPRQIEEAIYTYDAVEEATVIGVPDEYRGEAPKAFIKLKDGHQAKAEDILKHLSAKLSKIELPEEIEFRDELPKTMIGKLSRKELKAEELKRRSGA